MSSGMTPETPPNKGTSTRELQGYRRVQEGVSGERSRPWQGGGVVGGEEGEQEEEEGMVRR